MPNISRSITKPKASSPRTKVLLVRSSTGGVKSVRKSDEPDPTALRLAIGVIAVLGGLMLMWLMGFLGYRLGFASLVRVPDLVNDGGAGLATGAMILMSIPRVVFQAGMSQPLLLMLGFALIALPAASLGAITPFTPGGPRPKPEAVVASNIGAVLAIANCAALIMWSTSMFRRSLIQEIPFNPSRANEWLSNLEVASGLDVLGVIIAVLWVVVVMRLAVATWLRALSASACFFALAVITLAMSTSTAAVAEIRSGRPVFFLDDGPLESRLILGFTPRSLATMSVENGGTFVELGDRPLVLKIVGKQSIVEFLDDQVPREAQTE